MTTPNYAIARIKKHKIGAKTSYLVNHHLRLVEVQNADLARSKRNRIIFSVENPTDFLNDIPEKTRKNAVKFVDLLFTATRFSDKKHIESWVKKTTEFIEKEFGKENIALITLHLDESTPHIHCMIKPMKNGKLCASHWFDGFKKMHAYQDRYFASVKDLGFSRGIKGKRTRHKTVANFYKNIEEATHSYADFHNDLRVLYQEVKKGPNLWERFKPGKYFEKLVPMFNNLARSYQRVQGFQKVLEAEKKDDTIKNLRQHISNLEHKFEELAGCVPNWIQIQELREKIQSYSDFEKSIKVFEANQNQLKELVQSKKSETPTSKKNLKM